MLQSLTRGGVPADAGRRARRHAGPLRRPRPPASIDCLPRVHRHRRRPDPPPPGPQDRRRPPPRPPRPAASASPTRSASTTPTPWAWPTAARANALERPHDRRPRRATPTCGSPSAPSSPPAPTAGPASAPPTACRALPVARSSTTSSTYRALRAGQGFDVTDLYSTDAEIDQYHLRVLADDRHFFPAYRAVLPLPARAAPARPSTPCHHLEGTLDAAHMRAMNKAP